MHQTLLYHTPSIVITLCLFISMILFCYAGFYFKKSKMAKNPDYTDAGLGAIEGSLLGLLALLLSFTFSMSSSRHDNRFDTLVKEANAISTAILRADFFPDSERVALRGYFQNYVEARIAQYDAGVDHAKNKLAADQTDLYGQKLWAMTVSAVNSDDMKERNRGSLMANSLNDVIDAVTIRKATRDTMVPDSILWLLFLLCLASAFIVGYGNKRKPDFVMAGGFAIMIAITVFSILDLDRPHRGLITLDRAEQHMIELRELLK